MSPKSKAEAIKKQLIIINELLKKPENKYCADCKKISPTWASVNLGVFVCINCSGCHREIGVHITKIRSVNLDVWPKEILDNFKLINNQIANKYWECNLKKFDFKKIQNDKYKLVEFIRNKYENKMWIDTSKKFDPMTLISKGKIKKFKKLYCQDEDEEISEESEHEKKDKKYNKKIKTKKEVKNEEEEENEDDDDNFSDKETKEKNNNKNEENKNIKENKAPSQENINFIFDLNQNQNNNNQNNLNNNNSQQNLLNLNNDNIMDLFNSGNSQSSNDNINQNIIKNNNNYFSPQQIRSTGFDNIFQQMPDNTKLNFQKSTTNMPNINFNNNMMYGINNNNNTNNNFEKLKNNLNNLNNLNDNMNNLNLNNQPQINNVNNNNQNIKNINIQNNSLKVSPSSNIKKDNPISFNMEYFNKNMGSNKSNIGSTYNFKKKKEDPFASLVSFKK